MKFLQDIRKGPMGRTIVSLPGGFEPDSTVMVVVPVGDRSRPPTPDEFEEMMLGERNDIEDGIIDQDRVDAMRQLEVSTNEVPNTGQIEIQPEQRTIDALVVELTTSLSSTEVQFINGRMLRELSSTFFIDTFTRVIE